MKRSLSDYLVDEVVEQANKQMFKRQKLIQQHRVAWAIVQKFTEEVFYQRLDQPDLSNTYLEEQNVNLMVGAESIRSAEMMWGDDLSEEWRWWADQQSEYEKLCDLKKNLHSTMRTIRCVNKQYSL